MRRTLAVAAAIIAVAAALPPRNLTGPDINPGYEDYKEPWVVVTAGESANNTLHHLWGAKGALSFVVVAGTGGPNVTVDWEALHNSTPESISFEKEPSHVFGFVIPSLVLYNDVEDDGTFLGQNGSVQVPISNFTWSAEVLQSPSHQVAVMLQTTHYQNVLLPNNTRLSVQVSAYGEDGRSTVLPHLLYTPDSAQLELIFDNFNLNITNETMEWENARWGMDVMVFSSEHKTGEGKQEDFGIKFHTQKSLDDEHTPGVFDLDQMTTAGARAENKTGGYLQWRPVSYLSTKREISSATTPNLNTSFQELSNLTDPLKASLAYAVLGNKLNLTGAAITSFISFGQPKDGFYRSANFTTWTVAMGEGVPPQETFSTVVLVVISLGVVLPGAMFLVGCVVLATRRCRRRSSSASNLVVTDDE